MKVAILIAGYTRTLEHNIGSIKQNLIQNYDTDIFIHLSEEEKEKDKYWNKEISLDFIKRELNPKIIVFGKDKKFSDNNSVRNHWYKFYQLNKIRKEFSRDYDIVIKLRPDTYFHQKINYQTNNNVIYLPEDSKVDSKKLENNNFICDIFAYGSEKSMNEYFQIYEFLDEIIEGKITIPENIISRYFKMKNIKYKEINIKYSVILSLCKTISISGDSGSGKTTLSKMIQTKLKNSFILECDRYHKWERGDKKWEKMTHLNPEANYLAKMEKDVFDLKVGNSIYQIDYDHSTGKFTDKIKIHSKENIIVCGLHTNYKQNGYTLSIFIDTDLKLKKKWKIERDIRERGYSKEKILNQIELRNSDYQQFILPQMNSCNLIIRYTLLDEEIITVLGISSKLNYQIHGIKSVLKENYFWYQFESKDQFQNIFLNLIENLI